MGSEYFKPKKSASIGSGGAQSRAVGNLSYSTRSAAFGANKDIAAAMAINKAGARKKLTGSSAYAKGPKA